MSKNMQLLKQVRHAAATINANIDNTEYKAMLTAADYILNELMLQDSPDFYLQHIANGTALLSAGLELAARHGEPMADLDATRDDLSAASSIKVINSEIAKLQQSLLDIVAVLDEGRSAEEKDYLVHLSAWEASLYQHSLQQVGGAAVTPVPPITADALQAYLVRKFPDRQDLRVTKFVDLQGGFSKKTILFETEDSANDTQELVIRAEQAVKLIFYDGCDVAQEFYMIQLMRDAGLPIAEPLWLESDRSHLGTRFIVSRKAKGRNYGGNLGSTESLPPDVLSSVMASLIKLHNIKVSASNPLAQKSHLKDWLRHTTITDVARYFVKDYLPKIVELSGISLTPLFLRALKWLEKNIPNSDEAPVIVHVDFALNNLLIDNNAVTTVLDWESSRLGDPADDIIWTQENIGAFISMKDFLDVYKRGTGREVSPYRIAYARVARCALNGITCQNAMRSLVKYDAAPINMSIIAYKYMAIFGANFNKLIAEAEKLRE